jgi:hypothetical protein
MTTRILVDAHAGWDIEVVIQSMNDTGTEVSSERTQIVKAHTQETFYVHSHLQIGSIKEIKKE